MKKVAIIQSCYIPWKGYFDIINMVDEFVLFDDTQYTRRDWRNRNKIKTPKGPKWISIPVNVKGKYYQLINETRIADPDWGKRHWDQIRQQYAPAPYFKQYKDFFEPLFLNMQEEMLSIINLRFIQEINSLLDIKTKITWSSDCKAKGDKNERLVSICKHCHATEYISGPAAKTYIDESLFAKQGIKVSWMDYNNYPVYNQLYPPFEHGVTILDLLFHTGEKAKSYMKSFSTK